MSYNLREALKFGSNSVANWGKTGDVRTDDGLTEGFMRIGVVSDTHGHVVHTLSAVRMLESLDVEQVLHCGDIGSPAVVSLFAPWPTCFVLGNVDRDEATLRKAISRAGQTCYGRFGSLELAGVHVALLHGDDTARLHEVAHSGRYRLVCYGHTHVASEQYVDGNLLLNPGAIYRAEPHSIAIVELPEVLAMPIVI